MAVTPEGKKYARKIEGDLSPEQALGVFEAVMDATIPGMQDESDIYVFTSGTVLEPWLAWSREYFPKFGFERKAIMPWCKNGPGLGDLNSWGAAIEFILYYKRGKRLLSIPRQNGYFTDYQVVPKKLIHPHEKPVGLLSKFILHSTDPGDLVVDPFGGSGSLVRAAKSTGRHGVAIELDEMNYKLAKRALDETSDNLF